MTTTTTTTKESSSNIERAKKKEHHRAAKSSGGRPDEATTKTTTTTTTNTTTKQQQQHQQNASSFGGGKEEALEDFGTTLLRGGSRERKNHPATGGQKEEQKERTLSTTTTKKKRRRKSNVFAKLEGFRWWPALLLSRRDVEKMAKHNENIARALKLPRKKTREECDAVRFHGTGDVSLLAKDKIVPFNEANFKTHVGENFRGGGNGSANTGKKQSLAFQKAVEEAMMWERENDGDASSSSSSSDEEDEENDDEKDEKTKEEEKGTKKTKANTTNNTISNKKTTTTTTTTTTTLTKKRKKGDEEKAAGKKDDSSENKSKKTLTGAALKERRKSGKDAIISPPPPPNSSLPTETTTTTTTSASNKKKTTKKENDDERKEREEEKKEKASGGGSQKRGGTISPPSEKEGDEDVKQEEEKGDEAKEKEEEVVVEEEERKLPPSPPPPPLPLEPTKTWLEFSPIQASAFDASMNEENTVSIAPNEDIEQSSIVVQNEQMQMEEAHLNRARLTRNQRNNTSNNNNNNNNNENKKKAREQQQQNQSDNNNNNNNNNNNLGAKKLVSFAKQQEKIVANANNDEATVTAGLGLPFRGAGDKTMTSSQHAASTTKTSSPAAATAMASNTAKQRPRAATAVDSRFYKSCHQCHQQHVASPCEFGGSNSSNMNSNNNNTDTDNRNENGNQASKCCGASFCDQCLEKFYSHLTRNQCRKKCPKCRGVCNCRLCLRKEDVVGKSSSSSSKSNVTTIASLFEDSENIALASLEANLDIAERKKRASYCLVAMERAFAKSAECDAWEIQREKKKEKEEEKGSDRNNKSSSPSEDYDGLNDCDDDDENNNDDKKNKKRKTPSSNATNIPSAFCDACANDIVAVCLSCEDCDVRVCAYCISTLRKGTEAPYVERVCCLSHDDVARAKIKAEMSRRILSEKPAETKNASAEKGSSASPQVHNPSTAQKQDGTMNKITNNDENDSVLVPMKKRLKMAFKTLNSSFTDGDDDDLEKKSPGSSTITKKIAEQQQQQQQQQQQNPKEGEKEALKIAKKSKLEDDITCVSCDKTMKIDLRMYDFERVKEASRLAKKESASTKDKNEEDACPYCKLETNEENVRACSFTNAKGSEGTKIWTPDQKEILKAEKSALFANDSKQYNHFIAHFRYHWLRGDPIVVRNVETEMSWDPSIMERAMRDPNIASISTSSAVAGFGNVGGGGGGGGDNSLNSSGGYVASAQHDAIVPVFACGADEYDELAKMKKTLTPVKGYGDTTTTTTSTISNSASKALNEEEDAAKIEKKRFAMARSSTNSPKFSMALKDFFAGFFDPLLTFDGKLFQLRDFPRCIGGNRLNLKELLPKHFRRLLAALPFRLYTNPEVGTINLFALQFQKYVRGGGVGGGGGGGEQQNFFQGVSSNSRSRGDVAAKKFVESLVKTTFSYGNGTRTYVEGKSSIETFGVGSEDDVCSVNTYSSSVSKNDDDDDDKTIALWTVIRPQDAEEVLRRVESHEEIDDDALYLSDDVLEKVLLVDKPIARFAFAQREKECVLVPGGSLRQILNVRSNCRVDVAFSSPETVSGRRRKQKHHHPKNDAPRDEDDVSLLGADERRRVVVLKAAKACADVVLFQHNHHHHPLMKNNKGNNTNNNDDDDDSDDVNDDDDAGKEEQ